MQSKIQDTKTLFSNTYVVCRYLSHILYELLKEIERERKNYHKSESRKREMRKRKKKGKVKDYQFCEICIDNYNFTLEYTHV